jgi:hypothetical protein
MNSTIGFEPGIVVIEAMSTIVLAEEQTLVPPLIVAVRPWRVESRCTSGDNSFLPSNTPTSFVHETF